MKKFLSLVASFALAGSLFAGDPTISYNGTPIGLGAQLLAGMNGSAPQLLTTNGSGGLSVSASVTPPTDFFANGNITTQNLNPNSGTATTGSTVAITSLNSANTIDVQVSGVWTGTLVVQGTVDGTNWVNSGVVINYLTGVQSANIPSAATGIWQTGVEGFTAVRVSASAAITGTATVYIRIVSENADVSIDGMQSAVPTEGTTALPVAPVPQMNFRTTFAQAYANAVDPSYWTLVQTGSGMSVNQTGGNLVITSGTTANSETVIRSIQSFNNSFNLREQSILSQRIANNNFYVELVDVIGDGLPYSITNATTVVVTIPSNPFTAVNVGQSMYLGVITGAAGIPMKATIASVSGNNVTYTVAGWPASGSGTLSVFGWNYHHILYTSTTATNANYDAQRNGWPSGDTVATINTTASPGHVGQVFCDDGEAYFADSLVASTGTPAFVTRASRFTNIPTVGVPLWIQIHVLNGTSAPASTTTWTLGFVGMQTFASAPVALQGGKLLGAAGVPVNVAGGSLAANQSVNMAQVGGTNTVTGGVAGILAVGGNIADGSAQTANPVEVAGYTVTAVPSAALAASLTKRIPISGNYQVIVHEDSDQSNEWQYTTANSPLTTNTSTAMQAAQGSGIRNYLTTLSYQNTSATATVINVLDGASVIFAVSAPASMTLPANVIFKTPLKGTAATALNFQCVTTGTSTYVNAGGYHAN